MSEDLLTDIFIMRTTSCTELRKHLAVIVDQISTSHEAVIITRRGRPIAVLAPADALEAFDETEYLLKSPANAARLLAAIADFR